MKTPKHLQSLPIQSIRRFPGFHKFFPALRRIIAKIVASMRVEGFRSEEPIVVWYDKDKEVYYIVDGLQRYLAAVELNLPTVWVAIALFETKEEAIDYMIARQTERRNIERASVLNALLNANLYTRGGARERGSKVPAGALKNGESSAPASLQDIADILNLSRQTVARCKRDYFEQITPEEKDLLAAGQMDTEDLIVAIDGRREKSTPQSKIVRFFAKIGFTEAETNKLVALATATKMTPLIFAATVLRATLEETPAENAPSITPNPTSDHSNPPPVTIEIEVSTVDKSTSEPLALPSPSNHDLAGQQEKEIEQDKKEEEPAKEKDWKQWHQCQKEVLWYLYVTSASQSQTATASVYHDLEEECMGEKCHSLKAAEHEISRLAKHYSNATPPSLTEAQFGAALQAIEKLVID